MNKINRIDVTNSKQVPKWFKTLKKEYPGAKLEKIIDTEDEERELWEYIKGHQRLSDAEE